MYKIICHHVLQQHAVSATDISLACHVHQGGGGSSFGSLGGLGEFETYGSVRA